MATARWRWTVTRPSGWVVSRTVTVVTGRRCWASCCDVSATSSRSFTPTTAWPAEGRGHYTVEARRRPEGAGQTEETWLATLASLALITAKTFSVQFVKFLWLKQTKLSDKKLNLEVRSSWLPVFLLRTKKRALINVVLLCWCLRNIYIYQNSFWVFLLNLSWI